MYQKILLTKICPLCGKEFQTSKSYQKFCTRECGKIFDSQRRRKKYYESKLASKPSKKPTKTQRQSEKLRQLAQNAHSLRMQRQLEAKERGLTYGQYIALFGGEF